ncbi:hypothetical protein SAMN05661099_0039 [Daejeonella lutea]|uniref:Uncharacterized protein n=1 Tax=Daejeonella lutea TaxID=572036 RepID=A0A1T4ZWY8_9SPHI|nr:hypothetical protein SAMN05661099_0039 [Daejeonella lutea]
MIAYGKGRMKHEERSRKYEVGSGGQKSEEGSWSMWPRTIRKSSRA